MITKVLSQYYSLIKDQYGTFVLCSILENGTDSQREFILKQVEANAVEMSIDRDGSKLLENCIKMIGEQHTVGKKNLETLQTQILRKLLNIPMFSNQ